MKTHLKVIAATAIVALVIGFIAGITVKSSPTVQQGAQTIKYLSSTKLDLPKFNQPALRPSGKLIFLKGDKEIEYRSLCADRDYQVPIVYPSDILLTRREPISQSGNSLQFRFYDPKIGSEIINTYRLERSPWNWKLSVDMYSPVHAFAPIIGPKLEVGHRKVMFNIGAYLHPSEQNAYLLAGTSIKFLGN